MLCCFQQLVSYEIAENTQFKILEKKIDFKICQKFLRIPKNIHTTNTKHTPNCQKHSKFPKTTQNSSSLWSKKVKKTIMLIAKERLRLIRLAVGCKFAQTCHFADFSSFFCHFSSFLLELSLPDNWLWQWRTYLCISAKHGLRVFIQLQICKNSISTGIDYKTLQKYSLLNLSFWFWA